MSLCVLGIVLSRVVCAADVDVPNTAESIAKGRALYLNLCSACHGIDGKALIDVVSNATDLTDPGEYKSGSDNASIVKSIRDGVGAVMPAWGMVLKDPVDIQHLRNFIQSLWPEAQRPPVVK